MAKMYGQVSGRKRSAVQRVAGDGEGAPCGKGPADGDPAKSKALPTWKERFSERLDGSMRKGGLTSKELARRIGARESTVASWRNGMAQPTAMRVMPLCRALGVSPEWLLEGLEEGK